MGIRVPLSPPWFVKKVPSECPPSTPASIRLHCATIHPKAPDSQRTGLPWHPSLEAVLRPRASCSRRPIPAFAPFFLGLAGLMAFKLGLRPAEMEMEMPQG